GRPQTRLPDCLLPATSRRVLAIRELGRWSWMCNDQKRLGTLADALETLAEVLGIKSGQAFIQNNQVRVLKQSSCEENTAALPLRQLPACFTNHVVESTRHPLKQRSQPQFEAQLPRLLKILGRMRVGPPNRKINGHEAEGKIILVLWRGGRTERRPLDSPRRCRTSPSARVKPAEWPRMPAITK